MENLWERFKAFLREATAWRLISLITLLWVGASSTASVAAQPYAYVTNIAWHDVSVIDTATNTVVATIIVGIDPRGIALSPDGAFAYVAAGSGRDPRVPAYIAVIDTATNTVVARAGLPGRGSHPYNIALTPDGAFAYVTNGGGNNVLVLDTATRNFVAAIPVDDPEGRTNYTFGVAVSPDGAFAYVTGGLSLWVIDTATRAVVTMIDIDPFPGQVAFTPDGAFAYVTSLGSGNISVIDTQSHTVVARLPTGLFTNSVAFTPDGAFAYVTAWGGPEPGKVLAIDVQNHTVVATVPMAVQIPCGVAITPDGALAYVGNNNYPDGRVSVIDTRSNTVVATVPVDSHQPCYLAITPE